MIIETVARLGHHEPKDFLRFNHDHHWAPELGVSEWALEFNGGTDSVSARRIMLRLHRDRIRARGKPVMDSDFHDAPEIMGPVLATEAAPPDNDPLSTFLRAGGF